MANKGTTFEPSDEDFRRLCCLLILRREAVAACKELEIGAYRANVIAYAMALISARTKTKLPFADIWAAQTLTPAVSKALRIALKGCDKVIREDAATRRQNVTEFAKKDDCWTAVLAASIELDMGTGGGKWDGFSVADTVRPPEMIEATELFFRFSEAEWMKISKAVGECVNNPTYPGVAATMAKHTVIRKKPSDKQARILSKGLVKLREQDLVPAILKKILPDDWQILEQLAA